MRERGSGRIISIGSGASKHAAASLSYTTAKHGLVGFTKQLAQITGRTGITVNLLCPGWTNTSLLDFEAVARRAGTTVDEAVESARPRARSTVCSNPRSSRAWRRCSRPTTAPASPARSSPSTAATASDARPLLHFRSVAVSTRGRGTTQEQVGVRCYLFFADFLPFLRFFLNIFSALRWMRSYSSRVRLPRSYSRSDLVSH